MKMNKFPAVLVVMSLLIGGCADDHADPVPPDASIIGEMAKSNTAPLTIFLHHPKTVDLDLFVTDPFDEATYYGNSPTSHGSRLVKDTLCSSTQEQAIEVIEFPDPASGRYRIGLDFPESCDERVKKVPYLIVVNINGEQRSIRGTIELQHFLLIVDEFNYQGMQ
jgi:hypothetical protein